MVIHQMYKISAFGDFTDIYPSTESVLYLLNIFKESGMIPSMFQEVNFSVNPMLNQMGIIPQQTQSLQQRIALMTQDASEKIAIGSYRLDYEILLKNDNEVNEKTLADHNKKISNAINQIFIKYNKSSSRLALNTSSLISNMTEDDQLSFIKRYSNPISIYKDIVLDEWSTRLMTKKKIEINNTEELINIITCITKGQITQIVGLTQNAVPTNGFVVDIDINTIAENSANRFSFESISNFSSRALTIWNDLWSDII